MEPLKLDKKLKCGTTFQLVVLFRDVDGNIVDLGGCSARMQVRSEIDSDVVAVELLESNGRIVIDSELGSVLMQIEDSVTSMLEPGSYVYDLEVVTSIGTVVCPIFGKLKVSGEVTR